MKGNMKNIGLMPRLKSIEYKCNLILRMLTPRHNGKCATDSLIERMNTAAKELEELTKRDIKG